MSRTSLAATAVIAVMAVITVMAAALTPAQATPNSYPLICKGGGAMQARISPNATIQLRFNPGSAAGDAQAGQCTWIDRGFRPGEPAVLLLRANRSGMDYLLNGMLSGSRFYVHGYNNGNGSMIVTRVGP